MKTCYICGPITGTTDYEEKFNAAVLEVTRLGMQPVNPVILPHNHDKSWQSYMRECVAAMMNCDCIYILKGWNRSKGANIEREIAKLFCYEIYYQ